MDRTQYDTKEGIAQAIAASGLAGLRAVMEARREDHHEQLTPFVVLGRFYLRAKGRVAQVLHSHMEINDRASAPSVMTMEEWETFWRPIAARNPQLDPNPFSVSSPTFEDELFGFSIPPSHVTCKRCGRGWTHENCDDIEREREDDRDARLFSLAPYIGKTLREAGRDLIARQFDGEPMLICMVHNDRWVDTSIPQEQRHGHQTGWRNANWSSDPKITWDYVVQPGDSSIVLAIYHFYHCHCFAEHWVERGGSLS